MKKFKGFRTLALNVAFFVVMLGGAFTGQITDPDTLRWMLAVQTVANVVIRFFTTTAVGQSE